MDHLTLKSTVKKAELQSYLSNMHAMYENLNAEPPRATQIKTIEQGGEEEGSKVPFYGEQATTYLRNNLKGSDKSKVNRVSDTQPKDFANSGSGLFVGGSEQNNAEKQ